MFLCVFIRLESSLFCSFFMGLAVLLFVFVFFCFLFLYGPPEEEWPSRERLIFDHSRKNGVNHGLV